MGTGFEKMLVLCEDSSTCRIYESQMEMGGFFCFLLAIEVINAVMTLSASSMEGGITATVRHDKWFARYINAERLLLASL